MTLMLALMNPPLTTHEDGVVRVASTRVTLDTIVAAFCEGMSAEGIAEQYPSLRLPDVYLVIGYYLQHRAEVESYLLEREELAARVRHENETRFEPSGVRERLLARKSRN